MKKEIWVNHFVKVENARLRRKNEKIMIGKREIKFRYNGIFFECWFGEEGNDDLDRAQMKITGELKKRVRKFAEREI